MLKEIETRRSCKRYDPTRPVETEKIDEIVRAGLCAAAKLGHVPADFAQRRQEYLKQLENLRSGPVGDRIRSGMAISRL